VQTTFKMAMQNKRMQANKTMMRTAD